MNSIMCTVSPNGSLWVALFERTDGEGKAVARHVFGKEPSDPELYEFIIAHFRELKFSMPHDFKLVIKRRNPQRMQREVRREIKRARKGDKKPKESFAQEVMRKELEERKNTRRALSKAEKESLAEEKFQQRQEKRKEKHRGH